MPYSSACGTFRDNCHRPFAALFRPASAPNTSRSCLTWRGLPSVLLGGRCDVVGECHWQPACPLTIRGGYAEHSPIFSERPALCRSYRGKSPSEAAQAERVAVYQERAEASFVLAGAAAWLAPLLVLLQRVQLNIMGRHLNSQANIDVPR